MKKTTRKKTKGTVQHKATCAKMKERYAIHCFAVELAEKPVPSFFSVLLCGTKINAPEYSGYFLSPYMTLHFSERISWQPPVRHGNDSSLMAQLTAGAGRDIPAEGTPQATHGLVLEVRATMLQRLMERQRRSLEDTEQNATTYQAMMNRIESKNVSPMLAEEFDDFMNPDAGISFANNS